MVFSSSVARGAGAGGAGGLVAVAGLGAAGLAWVVVAAAGDCLAGVAAGVAAGGVCARASAGKRVSSKRIYISIAWGRCGAGGVLSELSPDCPSCARMHKAEPYRTLRQQEFEVFALQIANETVVFAQDGVGQIALGLLQLEHLFLHRVARNQAVGEDGARLADAVGAVHGLGFHRRVPPGIEQE